MKLFDVMKKAKKDAEEANEASIDRFHTMQDRVASLEKKVAANEVRLAALEKKVK